MRAGVAFVLTFCMLTTPVLRWGETLWMSSLDVYAGAILCLVAGIAAFARGVPRIVLGTTGAVLACLCYAVAVELAFSAGDTTGIDLFAKQIPLALAAHGYVVLLRHWFPNNALHLFFRMALIVALVQGAVLLLSFWSPDVRTGMDYVFRRDYSFGDHLVMQRTPGFVPTGGDGLSMNQALVSLVGAGSVLFLGRRAGFGVMTLLFVAVVSTIVTGRSGLYLGLAALVAVQAGRQSKNLVVVWSLAAILAVALAALPYFLRNEIAGFAAGRVADAGFEDPISRALSGFVSYYYTGEYSLSALDSLLGSMVVLPDTWQRTIFGNGDYGQLANTYIESDIGYIRMIFGIGVAGSILGMLSVLYPVAVALRRLKGFAAAGIQPLGDPLRRLTILVVLFGLLAHWKIFYLQTRIFSFVLFALCFLIVETTRDLSGSLRPNHGLHPRRLVQPRSRRTFAAPSP